MSQVVTILGIDPGYGRMGWCVGQVGSENAVGKTSSGANDLKFLGYDCIETAASLSIMERYQQIQLTLQEIIQKYHPQEAALESLFFHSNQKTVMRVSEARGLIIGALLNHHIACFEYTPLQIKQAVTGFGQAEKSAVERMLRLQFNFGHDKILDDTMDAIGVTMTHATSRKLSQLTKL